MVAMSKLLVVLPLISQEVLFQSRVVLVSSLVDCFHSPVVMVIVPAVTWIYLVVLPKLVHPVLLLWVAVLLSRVLDLSHCKPAILCEKLLATLSCQLVVPSKVHLDQSLFKSVPAPLLRAVML